MTTTDSAPDNVRLRLPYLSPFDWERMLHFFRMRAIDGVEAVEDGIYARVIPTSAGSGVIQVTDGGDGCLVATLPPNSDVADVSRRLAAMFDLASDLAVIGAHLSLDPNLAPLVAARPAVRVPGGWDGFEIAIRAIIGQQVSVQAARRLLCRLVERCGGQRPSRPFPTPGQVLAADLSAMGMPGARVATLKALALAVEADPALVGPGRGLDDSLAGLKAIKGIGEWTAHYIAMRACREPDAFPAADAGLMQAMTRLQGHKPRPKELIAMAEAWRPYRAYAAHHIWAVNGALGRPSVPARSAGRGSATSARP